MLPANPEVCVQGYVIGARELTKWCQTYFHRIIEEDIVRKLLCLAFVMLFPLAGFAAAGGMIAGTIKGPDGVPFKAAFVRARNVQTKITTLVLLNNQGKYSVDNLAPPSYEVSPT